ncbi:MAG: hypothetical protein LBL63_05295, partial [Clostridiales Family XIII bacterium]|jgi:heptaprenyl diphosphate synthase|nr:hypothetical protein [Clostridiales Family XIII bacterium]
LRDDLLDCGLPSDDKKPIYQDLLRGVYTLPVLYAARRNPGARFFDLIAKHRKERTDLIQIIARVEESGGFRYTKGRMEEYTERALDALQGLPDIEERDVLAKTVLDLNRAV